MIPSRKVTRYLDAIRERDALTAQLAQYPELRDSKRWMDDYNLARTRVAEYHRALTGGELGKARRLMEGR